MGTRWPGLNAATAAVFDRILAGQVTPGDLQQYNIRRATYFHRLAFAAAGFTRSTFFQASQSEYVTNWPGPSGLPDEHAMWMTHFGINIEHAHDVAYAAIAGGELGVFGAGSNAIAYLEDIRGQMQAGRVVGTIGSREFVNGHGLENYPLGIGVATGSAMSNSETAATTQDRQMLQFANGAPVLSNKFELPYPAAVLPGKALKVEITNSAMITVTVASVLVCQVEGILVSPANL